MYQQSEDAFCECKGIQLAYSVSCNNVTFCYSTSLNPEKKSCFYFLKLDLDSILNRGISFEKTITVFYFPITLRFSTFSKVDCP